MFFSFQESKIWEGSNNIPDPERMAQRIKAKSEIRARKKLPKAGVGRVWILMREEA